MFGVAKGEVADVTWFWAVLGPTSRPSGVQDRSH